MEMTGQAALFKAVLIDDDLLMLEDLESLVDWAGYGFRVVATFGNGFTALEQMERLRPDFIITDIRMPRMDGLSFVARVREILPEARILLLTAYSDFDYAKKAIELGVSNYLLKNELNRQTLAGELEKIGAEMARRRNMTLIMMQKVLKRFLYDQADGEARERLERGLKEGTVRACGFMMVQARPILEFPDEQVDTEDLSCSCHEIDTALSDGNFGAALRREEGLSLLCATYTEREVAVLVCSADRPVSDRAAMELMGRAARAAHGQIRRQRGGQATVLYSAKMGADLNWVHETFRFLSEVFPYMAFDGEGRIREAGELTDRIREEPFGQEERELLHRLSVSGTAGELIGQTRELEAQLGRQYSLRRLRAAMEWMRDVLARLGRDNLCPQRLLDEFYEELPQICSCGGLFLLFREFLEKMSRLDGERYSQRICRTLKFIHENYGRDISVQDAAEVLGLNGEYLNKLFKKEVNQSFSRYLTGFRMNRAREILESGECNVNEAAAKVGYKSSQYFSITFRQYMGYPPSEAARHRGS
ncbi:MAG: response regulator [Enterocloster asparagiformis]|nr:response regulator [Enterocloster asparagiformis]